MGALPFCFPFSKITVGRSVPLLNLNGGHVIDSCSLFFVALLWQVDSLLLLIDLFPDLTWTLGDLLPLLWWTTPIQP